MEDVKLKFKKFTEAGGRFSNIISLNKVGGFCFSAGFFRKHIVDKLSYVVLFFDRRNKAVGFSFYKEQVKGAFKISRSKRGTASVRPNSFIKAHGIKSKLYAGKYEPRKHRTEEGENIFYIVLQRKKQ